MHWAQVPDHYPGDAVCPSLPGGCIVCYPGGVPRERPASRGATPRKTPCPTCPYRKDVPAGLWHESEYAKLPKYDGETGEQVEAGAFTVFFCHQRTGELCAGWVGCHNMRHNLAIRMAPHRGVEIDYDAVMAYVSPVPLFASGAEAAEHGRSGIKAPSAEAEQAMAKLRRLRARRLAREASTE